MSEFQKQSIIAINGETVAKGFQIARQEARKVEPILVTGSHYVVGETLKFMK
jgi:folylpolyglutamate synthase/dihydropteroate synthase